MKIKVEDACGSSAGKTIKIDAMQTMVKGHQGLPVTGTTFLSLQSVAEAKAIIPHL